MGILHGKRGEESLFEGKICKNFHKNGHIPWRDPRDVFAFYSTFFLLSLMMTGRYQHIRYSTITGIARKKYQ